MKVLIPVCVYCKSLIKVKDIFIDPINAVLLKYSCECQWMKTRTIYLQQYYDRLYYANYFWNGPCPVHAKQKQKYYCNDCKNSLCEKCKNKKIHKKHSIISFKELSLFLKNFYSK